MGGRQTWNLRFNTTPLQGLSFRFSHFLLLLPVFALLLVPIFSFFFYYWIPLQVVCTYYFERMTDSGFWTMIHEL